ncbi:MAG: hypothetical protein IJS08_00025 [Victivallales bacterium]|nr:hypothetical protein [Victivallales bacterium]
MFDSFFSNKCQAYVDENGKALTGAALEAAKRNPNARRCGARVALRAKFCRVCGSPASTAWWRCGACGKWIGQESEICPNCGHHQDMAARISLDNGVWRKGDDVFAQRFELNDVAAMFSRGLVISEGQCAILLRNGVLEKVLPPGKYAAGELANLDDYVRSGNRKSLVMVDLSDIAYPVVLSGLRSKDDIDLSLECRIHVKFSPVNAANFLANVLGHSDFVRSQENSASVVSYEAIAKNLLLKELEVGVADFCNLHTIDELFKDASLHNELEDYLQLHLRRALTASGLVLLRIGEVDFRGGFYERLREMSGDVEKKRRELEIELRMEELLNDEAKRKALGKDNLDDYLAQLELERDMKGVMRADELARVKEAFERDRALAELENRWQKERKEHTDSHALEMLDAEHDREVRKIRQSAELERRQAEHSESLRQRLAEQNASLEYARIELLIEKEREAAAVELASRKLDLEEKKNNIQNRNDRERAEILQPLDILTRISMAKTPAEAHILMKTYKAQLRDGKDPMQLLAEAAADGNREAAEALKNMSQDKIDMLEKLRMTEAQVLRESLDRQEREHDKALDAIVKVAQGRATGNTTQIFKP